MSDVQSAAPGPAATDPGSAGDVHGKLSLKNIDFIMDIPLEVTVRLGRARLPIKDLLELGAGSVIELDRVAGEPLEVLVNDKLVARGEAIVVADKFGIRLSEIVSPTERILGLE